MSEADQDVREADLEMLLDQFREPEEPPRKKMPGVVWVIFAMICTLVAGWLAVRATVGFASAKPQSTEMKPTKFKERKPREAAAETTSVVEDYIARCKRGMTAREVRWIVEDFQKAGLDLEIRSAPPEEFVAQRKTQHAWYLDLLTEGLGFTRDQRLSASEALDDLLAGAAKRFDEELAARAGKEFESGGKHFRIVDSAPIHRLISAESWLADEHYAPWELCELNEDQKRVTWHSVLVKQSDTSDGAGRSWLDVPSDSQVMRDPQEQEVVNSFPLRFASIPPGGEDYVRTAAVIFPRTPDPPNAGPAHETPLAREARNLHPAQLKVLLMLRPELAVDLLQDIEPSGE